MSVHSVSNGVLMEVMGAREMLQEYKLLYYGHEGGFFLSGKVKDDNGPFTIHHLLASIENQQNKMIMLRNSCTQTNIFFITM